MTNQPRTGALLGSIGNRQWSHIRSLRRFLSHDFKETQGVFTVNLATYFNLFIFRSRVCRRLRNWLPQSRAVMFRPLERPLRRMPQRLTDEASLGETSFLLSWREMAAICPEFAID